jgi:hypothetical protein
VVLFEFEHEALDPAAQGFAAVEALVLVECRDGVSVATEGVTLGLVDRKVEGEVWLVVHETQHPIPRLESGWNRIG